MPGTPATSPNFNVPRYADTDAVNFSAQVNAITDGFDAAAVKAGSSPSLNVLTLNGGLSVAQPLGAPPAPALSTANSGGSVLAGTYTAAITYVNPAGETVASSTATIATTGTTSTITVPSPPAMTNATGWYAYVSQAGGSSLTRQQSTPTAIGTALVISAPPSNTGSAPSGSSTANVVSVLSTSQPASSYVLTNRLLPGDTNAAFRVAGNGTHTWGAGGSSATDVTLARSSAQTLTLTGSLTITINAAIGGTLAAGASTLTSVAVTNNATVGGTLGVTGQLTANNGITAGVTSVTGLTAGASTLNSLSVTNNATVGGSLTVTGGISGAGLSVSGTATLSAAALVTNSVGGLDLSGASGTSVASGTGVGDKVTLYGGPGGPATYALGVQSGFLVAAFGGGGQFAVRAASPTGNVTSGPNILTVYGGSMLLRHNSAPTDSKGWRTAVDGTTGSWNLQTMNDAESVASGAAMSVTRTGNSPTTLTLSTGNVQVGVNGGNVGFFGVNPTTRPTVNGSRSGGLALTNLLISLSGMGIILDSTGP